MDFPALGCHGTLFYRQSSCFDITVCCKGALYSWQGRSTISEPPGTTLIVQNIILFYLINPYHIFYTLGRVVGVLALGGLLKPGVHHIDQTHPQRAARPLLIPNSCRRNKPWVKLPSRGRPTNQYFPRQFEKTAAGFLSDKAD
jgi:hypothetical protein